MNEMKRIIPKTRSAQRFSKNELADTVCIFYVSRRIMSHLFFDFFGKYATRNTPRNFRIFTIVRSYFVLTVYRSLWGKLPMSKVAAEVNLIYDDISCRWSKLPIQTHQVNLKKLNQQTKPNRQKQCQNTDSIKSVFQVMLISKYDELSCRWSKLPKSENFHFLWPLLPATFLINACILSH